MVNVNNQLLKNECVFTPPSSVHASSFSSIRKQFPAIKENTGTIFFDNAATTQKPQQVIDAMNSFYMQYCVNANRAAYSLSSKLHQQVEITRATIARLINGEATDIAFTSGATDSLNLVALAWGLHNLNDRDEVMLCLEDHQSAILPWINLKLHLNLFGKHIEIVHFPIHYSGIYDRKSICEKITPRTRLVAMTHIHNLYGLEWDGKDLAEIRAQLPDDTLISLDVSQSIGHTVVDTDQLAVDFISFSGHKMFAANGIGVLWVNPKIREKLYPARIGSKSSVTIVDGEMKIDRSTLAGILECGTLNLPAIYSLKSAVEFIESIGMKNIETHVSYLTRFLYEKLRVIPTIEFAPGVNNYNCAKGFGIISFRFSGISSSDMAQYLDQRGVQVRSGDHCLATKHSEEADYIRVSLHIYNTEEEIDLFVKFLEQVLSWQDL